ncbi:MAG: DMT family transporter [Acidiferrobacter thiooxydans]|jgi:drug/metabolite transporter (DMT)-like permease
MAHRKTLLLLVLATSLMGSSFAVVQMGIRYAPPLFLAGLRFSLAGLILAFGIRQRPHPHDWRLWARVIAIGLLQTTGVMGAIFLSLQTIPAGESAILTFANPMLVVVFSAFFLGTRYRAVQWIGAALGLAGVAVAVGIATSDAWHLHIGVVYGLASAVFWAVATLLLKRWGPLIDSWVMTAYQMLVGGVFLIGLGALLEGPHFQITPASIIILVWLVVMASIVQFGAWFYVLHHEDPARASAYLFLAPVFGVVTGWGLLNQPIGVDVVIGTVLIVAAIWLINRMQTAVITNGSLLRATATNFEEQ